jgi:hypothetical protein
MKRHIIIVGTVLLAAVGLAVHAEETRIECLGNSLTDELKHDAFVQFYTPWDLYQDSVHVNNVGSYLLGQVVYKK